MPDLRCMCGAADCRDCYGSAAITLVPCAGAAHGCEAIVEADTQSLWPADFTYCEACQEARADDAAASLPGQEIENEAWS